MSVQVTLRRIPGDPEPQIVLTDVATGLEIMIPLNQFDELAEYVETGRRIIAEQGNPSPSLH